MRKRNGAHVCLIATDAEPLLALAAADELDALLMPNMRVLVPDMARHDLGRLIDAACAQDVPDWIRGHDMQQVFVVSREEYEDGMVL